MKKYTYDEVYEKSLSYFNGDTLSTTAFIGKYALKDYQNNLFESYPPELHARLAKEFHRIELKYPNPMSLNEIFSLLSDVSHLSKEQIESMPFDDLVKESKDVGSVIPQGSPMSGIGNDFQLQSLSNCFVVDSPHDSYGGICYTDQRLAQIMKRRGGVGVDISTLRPRGFKTNNAAITTDGITAFAERFSNTTREVAQGGRRGALMVSLSCAAPQILDFIKMKNDLTKVTGANVSVKWSDEFMNALVKNEKYELKFPVDSDNPEYSEMIEANKVWDEFIKSAHATAEPGALFWDTIIRNSPADIYADQGFKTISTNPCLTGDTLVAVADGRGYVSIKQLVEEGQDVPVYAQDLNKNKIIISYMRNPRLTGEKLPVYKVTIEGGHSFKATGNHKMIMLDGTERCVDKLQFGDQLIISKRSNKSLVDIGTKTSNRSSYTIIENSNYRKTEHKMIWEFMNNERVPANHVIHHNDYNSLNNNINNLRLMSHEDHKNLHADKMKGLNNPIFKIKANPERFVEYLKNLSKSLSGNNNPRAFDLDQETFINHIKLLTQKLGRRIKRKEWIAYAEQNSLPRFANKWRCGGIEFYDLTVNVAKELGFKYADIDQRKLRTLNKILLKGLEAEIINNEIIINRICEQCKKNFTSKHNTREICFCSNACVLKYSYKNKNRQEQQQLRNQKVHSERAKITRKNQLDVYTQLRLILQHDPQLKEWINECKNKNIQYRLGTKYGFKSWQDLKNEAKLHNHRVVSVEFAGYEDVYNGTVDEVHNYFIGGWKEINVDTNKDEYIQILTRNCGELPLPDGDSCRLILINLSKFVVDAFTDKAYFDYQKYANVTQKAQRLMDNLVDLELEKIDQIIEKINNDPEPIEIKQVELTLWNNIREKCVNGRRTGLGVTAVGDVVAMLGIRYASDESIKLIDELMKCHAVNAYKSSCKMAQERGSFPIWNYEKEVGHPYLELLYETDEELRELAKHGRRNIALLTIAPAGTISIYCRTSSGIEPVFMLQYVKKKKINPSDVNARVDSTDDLGDKWQHFTISHPGLQKWMEVTGETDIKKSPYWGSTAQEIDFLKKVELQAAAQKWIDHSISNTINMPADVDLETVSKVYIKGWQLGCKGITIYRDGSRSGVLVSVDDKNKSQPQDIIESHAPKRPKELECDIHRVNVKGESYLVLVGLLNNKPYEVFCGLSENIIIPKKCKKGVLVKNGKKDGVVTYNLKIAIEDDELVFKDVVNLFANPLYGTFTRTLSLALRHGIKLEYIVEQLRKDKFSDITSFSSVVARVLSKNYIADGTKITGQVCDSCGSSNLAYQSGCMVCLDCANSKCG